MIELVLRIFLSFVIWCAVGSAINFNQPIKNADYQGLIGPGFATNYFKTLAFQKYHKQNLIDVYARGFRNLRLRCRADLEGLNMTVFLHDLDIVVDDCLEVGIIPIISWEHHEYEAYATEEAKESYLEWWRLVAKKLRYKDYRLSFNLFTELGIDVCQYTNCSLSLRENATKYNDWTRRVTRKIRNTAGNNQKRILILGSPTKDGKGLDLIDPRIYKNDEYMMVEWHLYASGPNKNYLANGRKTQKYWSGDGSDGGKANVDKCFTYAHNFTSRTNVTTYFGAWMAEDNKKGDLNQVEIIHFVRYFVEQAKPIPWSLNVLDRYYDTRKSYWLTNIQDRVGAMLNMSTILENIIDVM